MQITLVGDGSLFVNGDPARRRVLLFSFKSDFTFLNVSFLLCLCEQKKLCMEILRSSTKYYLGIQRKSSPKKCVWAGQLQVISLFYIKLSKRKLPREKVGASTPPHPPPLWCCMTVPFPLLLTSQFYLNHLQFSVLYHKFPSNLIYSSDRLRH